MASRVPSGDSAQPALAPKFVNRNVQVESIGVSLPSRPTQTISNRRNDSDAPVRNTRVPVDDRAMSGRKLSISNTLSINGTEDPRISSEPRSNGAANIPPSRRT